MSTGSNRNMAITKFIMQIVNTFQNHRTEYTLEILQGARMQYWQQELIISW